MRVLDSIPILATFATISRALSLNLYLLSRPESSSVGSAAGHRAVHRLLPGAGGAAETAALPRGGGHPPHQEGVRTVQPGSADALHQADHHGAVQDRWIAEETERARSHSTLQRGKFTGACIGIGSNLILGRGGQI